MPAVIGLIIIVVALMSSVCVRRSQGVIVEGERASTVLRAEKLMTRFLEWRGSVQNREPGSVALSIVFSTLVK